MPKYVMASYDKDGEETQPNQVLTDPSTHLPNVVKRALTMNGVLAVEIHYRDGTSREWWGPIKEDR